jgi:hypothetical protein
MTSFTLCPALSIIIRIRSPRTISSSEHTGQQLAAFAFTKKQTALLHKAVLSYYDHIRTRPPSAIIHYFLPARYYGSFFSAGCLHFRSAEEPYSTSARTLWLKSV